MTDTENVVASLESLRHKHAYRRGQVTKVKTKTNRLLEQDPEDIDLRIVENLLLALTTHMNMHNAIQTQMVELYNAHPAHAVDEEEECDRIADAHQAVKNLLLDVQQAVPLWGEAAILLKQIERKLDTPHADSPMFRSVRPGCEDRERVKEEDRKEKKDKDTKRVKKEEQNERDKDTNKVKKEDQKEKSKVKIKRQNN